MSPSSCQVLSDLASTERSRQQLHHLHRLAAIGGMTSQVAHELNNTLTALLGWAQKGLKSVHDAEAAGKAMVRVCDNAERAAEICRGLLGLGRPEAGAREKVAVNDIIKEALGTLQNQLEKQSISFRCRCPDDLAVYGRRVELVQVLLNMMINSSQAMAGRGGMLNVCADQDGASGCVNISVSDNGPGIKARDIRRIFEPFFSTKPSPDGYGQGGTGLGLAICKDIITSHGGFIEVDSVEGQGATFRIYLPSSPH